MSQPLTTPAHACRIGKVTFKRSVSSRQLLPFNTTTNMLRRAAQKERARP